MTLIQWGWRRGCDSGALIESYHYGHKALLKYYFKLAHIFYQKFTIAYNKKQKIELTI
jgi:hypothetical protein